MNAVGHGLNCPGCSVRRTRGSGTLGRHESLRKTLGKHNSRVLSDCIQRRPRWAWPLRRSLGAGPGAGAGPGGGLYLPGRRRTRERRACSLAGVAGAARSSWRGRWCWTRRGWRWCWRGRRGSRRWTGSPSRTSWCCPGRCCSSCRFSAGSSGTRATCAGSRPRSCPSGRGPPPPPPPAAPRAARAAGTASSAWPPSSRSASRSAAPRPAPPPRTRPSPPGAPAPWRWAASARPRSPSQEPPGSAWSDAAGEPPGQCVALPIPQHTTWPCSNGAPALCQWLLEQPAILYPRDILCFTKDCSTNILDNHLFE